jgi:glutamyl-tRNA reductase
MERGQRERAEAAAEAGRLVQAEAERFFERMSQLDIGAHIGAMTQHSERIRLAEIGRSEKILEGLTDKQRQGIEAMTRSMMKKMLHGQIQAIRHAARHGDAATIDTLMRPWSSEDEGNP